MSNSIMVVVEVWTDNKFISKHEYKYGDVELQRFFYAQIALKNQVRVYDKTQQPTDGYLTERKTRELENDGYERVGAVLLHPETDRRALVEFGKVTWDKGNRSKAMLKEPN